MIDYTEEESLSMLSDERKTDELLANLTGEDVKKLLIYINSKVRNIPNEENGIFRGTMMAGELISPNNDIQDEYFEKIASSLKHIKGNRNRATLLHYLINELHLFEDGNGRTGRCIYELFTNPEFSFENNDNFSHKSVNYIGTSEFEKSVGIKNYSNALQYPSYLVYKLLCENGLVNQGEKCIYSQTYPKEGVFGLEYYDLLFVDDSIKNTLSTQQIKDIGLALCDNNEMLSVSGLTMMIMQGIKGKAINYNELDNLPECSTYQPIIDIDDEESKETFKGWSKEDYLRATQIASIIKETMLDAMLDIFEHPENFVIDNSIAISDILAKNIGNEEQSGLEIIAGLYQNCNVNFNGTRIHSNIARIKGVMEQDISDLNNGTFQDIQSIVNQIIPEISNPNLEDETERQTQSDIKQLVDKGTQEK